MIVVAIIGILAAVAVPQYQDYIIRTEAASALSDVRTVQLHVNEYAARYATLAPATATPTAITTYTGIPATGNASGNLSDISIAAGGVLTLTFDTVANGVNVALAGKKFTMTPTMVNGSVTWATSVPAADGIDPKYLPKM